MKQAVLVNNITVFAGTCIQLSNSARYGKIYSRFNSSFGVKMLLEYSHVQKDPLEEAVM